MTKASIVTKPYMMEEGEVSINKINHLIENLHTLVKPTIPDENYPPATDIVCIMRSTFFPLFMKVILYVLTRSVYTLFVNPISF